MISTFALNGPQKCSGLNIVRYDEKSITVEFGDSFRLQKSVTQTHITPKNNKQELIYFLFTKQAA